MRLVRKLEKRDQYGQQNNQENDHKFEVGEIVDMSKIDMNDKVNGMNDMDDMSNWEKDMVQHSMDDIDNVKGEGGKDMSEAQKELSEKEIEEMAYLKMRNMEFTSLSNKKKKQEEEKPLFELDRCLPVFRNGSVYKWITVLNCYELAEMYSENKSSTPSIIYDSTIQRGIKVNSKGEEKPLIFNSNVKTILSKMLDGSMDAGQILLNYSKEYPDELHYDQENGILSGKHPLTICDAAHRLESMKIWAKKFKKNAGSIKDPREFYIPTIIFNLDHKGAENLFVEANSKGKPISRTRLAFHDVFNQNRKIVDIIEKNSLLKGRIEEVSGTIKKSSNKILTYKMLLDNVGQFKATTPKEVEEIGLYLCDFWDELINNVFPKAMGNIDPEMKAEQMKNNFILQNMFIAGYFTLANKLREVDDWKSRLKKLAENDFLNRNNPNFSFCLTEDNKIANSSKIQKRVGEKMLEYIIDTE